MKTVYFNAAVYTGEEGLQEAFLVEDGMFAAVGTNEAMLALTPEKTVDLKGAFVCPGFTDSHMHLINYGQTLSIAPLAEHTRSMEDLIRCLSETAPGRGGWILGRGWNQDFFSGEKRMPNRWDLDAVSTEFPVCAVRACGHALSVNSKVLELLDITADTPQPDGGQIVLENGIPNGVFLDNAMDAVYAAIPAPTKDELKDMIRAACRKLAAYGITSVHSDDYSTFRGSRWQDVNDAYRELEASGELTVRVYEQANFPEVAQLESFLAAGNNTGTGSDLFRIGPLKLLGDGALGARTAYLSHPYADDPSTCGLSVFSQEAFDALIGCANRNGMQVAVHCIGDACLDMVLSSLEKALAEHPREDHRHGIVHCQITRPDQLERIAAMKLHVYAQSIFLDYDIHIVYPRAGAQLASTSYSWKTLMQKGVTVSNGSDCPVELPFALGGIQCAVTRTDLAGTAPPYLKQEAFSVKEALDSYTAMGAYASFRENRLGRIAPGMLADFTVLDRNPFAMEPSSIKDISPLATFLQGHCVFCRH